MVLSTILLLASALHAGEAPPVIFGADDRREAAEAPAPFPDRAKSTVAIFIEGGARPVGTAGELALLTRPYERDADGIHPLCPDVRFKDQKKGYLCSGGLIHPRVVLTAGHCAVSFACGEGADVPVPGQREPWVVFGFAGAEPPQKVPPGDVYRCVKKSSLWDSTDDWGLLVLDRPVKGHDPLKLNRAALAVGDQVFAIGHPAGLPARFIGGAKVSKIRFTTYQANLDGERGLWIPSTRSKGSLCSLSRSKSRRILMPASHHAPAPLIVTPFLHG